MSYSVADEVKRNQWKKELASHKELSSEQLLGIFPSDLIHEYDKYHRAKLAESLIDLANNPLPVPADAQEAEEQEILQNNVSTYDDVADPEEFWDLIYEDDVIAEMTRLRSMAVSEEAATKALRVRVGIVAHFLLDVIRQSQARPEDVNQLPNAG